MAAIYKTAVNFLKYLMRLAGFSFYCVCWFLVSFLDFVTNSFSFSSTLSPRKTARLGQILCRQKLIYMTMFHMSPFDFLCLFRTRVSRDYVLKSNVSLYAVTTKEAIFVETPIGINIYSSEVNPFFMAAQYLNATNVIKMSISDFVSLADKIGDPTVPIMWMSNTGRCGGSILTQMVESVPGTLAINQPDSPTNLYFLREYNQINDDDYKVILKSIIRILCKPCPGIERICIKPRPMCTPLMNDISNLCPHIRQLFIYRNVIDTVRSFLAVLESDPYPFVLRACTDAGWFSKLVPYFRNTLQHFFISKKKVLIDMPQTSASLICYGLVNQILFARDALSKDSTILSVKYEDILTRPREKLRHIFESVGIADEHLDRALTSLERDSQRGTSIGREKVRDTTTQFMSALDRVKCDAILSKYNLYGWSFQDITVTAAAVNDVKSRRDNV